jgi:hypothetical protein
MAIPQTTFPRTMFPKMALTTFPRNGTKDVSQNNFSPNDVLGLT